MEFGEAYLQLGDWRLGAYDEDTLSLSHRSVLALSSGYSVAFSYWFGGIWMPLAAFSGALSGFLSGVAGFDFGITHLIRAEVVPAP